MGKLACRLATAPHPTCSNAILNIKLRLVRTKNTNANTSFSGTHNLEGPPSVNPPALCPPPLYPSPSSPTVTFLPVDPLRRPPLSIIYSPVCPLRLPPLSTSDYTSPVPCIVTPYPPKGV